MNSGTLCFFPPNGIWLRKEECLQGTVTSPALSQTARSTQQYLQMLKLKWQHRQEGFFHHHETPLKITGALFYCIVANNEQSLRQCECRSVSSRRVPLSLCSICKLLGMIPEESVTTLAAEPCQSLCRPTVRCGLLLSLESYLAWSHACVEFYIKKKKELKLFTPQRGNINKNSLLLLWCHYLVSHEETQI